jgi:hypothetical protein
MNKKLSNKCNKRFTRPWNLQRHLKSIYNIYDYGKNDNEKQKYDRPTYSDPSPNKNEHEHSRYSENKISERNHYSNPCKYHKFTIDFIVKEIKITGFTKI